MSNLQIMALALHYATGRSAKYWTKVLQTIAKSDPVIAANLAKIPPDHVKRLEALQQESAGILQWLLTK